MSRRSSPFASCRASERRVAEPMLPLSIFRVPTMSASLLASLFQGLASFAVLFLLIMYLQGPRRLSPIHASLLLVPGYVLGSAVPLPGQQPGGGEGGAAGGVRHRVRSASDVCELRR